MKINRMTQNYIGTQKKTLASKGADGPQDQVTIGQNNNDLDFMGRIGDIKADGASGFEKAIAIGIFGIGGGVGAAMAGIGAAGRAFGGPVGGALAVAVPSTALGLLGFMEKGQARIQRGLVAAGATAALTGAGALLGETSIPLALGAGYVGGVAGMIAGIRYGDNMQ